MLTGAGLSKTGVGTYSITGAAYYNLAYSLSNLTFSPNAIASGQTRTTNFALAVTDDRAGLTATEAKTSVETIGNYPTPMPPLIVGAVAGESLTPGGSNQPFAGVTVEDPNVGSPTIGASISVNVAGSPSDADGTLSGTGLTKTGAGVYMLAAVNADQ